MTDEHENHIYYVQGKVLSLSNKKFVQDLKGNTLYTVRNKLLQFVTYYEIIYDKDDNEVARCRRKVFSLHDHYDVNTKFGPMVLRGNILGFDYHIFLNNVEIGHVGRNISLRDSFFIDVDETKIDPAFMIALVIAIDNITDLMNQQASY